MSCSKQVAFSIAALSGIAIVTLLYRRHSSLRTRTHHFKAVKESKDFISQLPDDILVNILSCLSKRDSVRTNILSKRWRNLYAFVPHMNFSLQPNLETQPNCLTVLNLDKVTLKSNTMACILFNCLNLQRLCIQNCFILDSKLSICGSNLRLKYLLIKFCSNIDNLELCANNLTSFEYFGCKIINFSFEHVPKLEALSLTFSQRLTPFSCGQLARALPPVKRLSLQINGRYSEMFKPAGISMFRNVTRLYLGSMFKSDQLSDSVALVLERCRLLCEFHLQTEKTSAISTGKQVTMSYKFHKNLKKVIFSGFSGTESEMNAAIYILKSATVLEQMIISYGFPYYLEKARLKRERTERQLSQQTISKNAVVIVRPGYISVSELFDQPLVVYKRAGDRAGDKVGGRAGDIIDKVGDITETVEDIVDIVQDIVHIAGDIMDIIRLFSKFLSKIRNW